MTTSELATVASFITVLALGLATVVASELAIVTTFAHLVAVITTA